MGIIGLLNNKKKKFTIVEVASDEIAMFALAFLIAKYFSAITSLAWYWYAIVFVIFIIKPIRAMVKK